MHVLRSLVVAVVAFVVLATPTVVLADGRVALVVGNSTYAHIGRLPNPDSGLSAHLLTRPATRGRLSRLLAVALLVVWSTACDGSLVAPATPSSPGGLLNGATLTGTWSGWLANATTGRSSATVTMFEAASVVSGSWTIFDADTSTSGNLVGTVIGSTAFLTLRPRNPNTCGISIVASVTSVHLVASTTLNGTWSTLRECEMPDRGTIYLLLL